MAGNSQLLAGLSLQEGTLEWLVLDTATGLPVQSSNLPLNPGELDLPPAALADRLKALVGQIPGGVKGIHLSVPTTLLRLTEMPSLPPKEMTMALSSEAERYRVFDGADAVVGYYPLPAQPFQAPGVDRIVFSALRQDRLSNWLQACKLAKLKLLSVDIHVGQQLRALAATGVLDGILQQAGEEAYWGLMVRGKSHLWMVLWQGVQLVELREVTMEMSGWEHYNPATLSPEEVQLIQSDVLDEVRRTIQNRSPIALWLAENIPLDIREHVQGQLDVAVRPALLEGPLGALGLSLPVVGAAYKGLTPFPFGMNFLESSSGVKGSAGPQSPAAGALSKGASQANDTLANLAPKLFGFGLASCVLLGLLALGLFLFKTMAVEKQLNELTTQETAAQQQEIQLKQQVATLQEQQDARQYVAQLMDRVLHQNALYPYLLRDLKRLTPPSVWIYNVQLGPQFTLAGKAMNEKPILTFARQWDGLPYVSKIDVASIKEVRDDTLGRVTYEFNLAGQGSPATLDLPQRTLPKPLGEPSLVDAAGKLPAATPVGGRPAPKTKTTFVGGLG
ncbi:MAG: PilN domain-containing protein [Vampirovibrionales bacterium]|nr:PilN domain-containing protein [Vampirovibrionales bacterium]